MGTVKAIVEAGKRLEDDWGESSADSIAIDLTRELKKRADIDLREEVASLIGRRPGEGSLKALAHAYDVLVVAEGLQLEIETAGF
ncbi:hypothetical protein EXS54_00550 [Patescibacteria group bacterium]|nr:hypothetical protein [Patescibacteria group bacterium]